MKIIIVMVSIIFASNAYSAGKIFTANNLAIGGVDVVAYFTDSKPTLGEQKYSMLWQGAMWHFSSQQHLDLFQSNPSHYAPRFGGFCSLTTAHGASIPVNPMIWKIYKDKLYLFIFEGAKETWLMNPDELIERAEIKWSDSKSS
jgi:YHS domain-containing protein